MVMNSINTKPQSIKNEEELEKIMCEPSDDLAEFLSKNEGDYIVIGAGGKMGPTLTKLLKNGLLKAKKDNVVYAVDRKFDPRIKSDFEKNGIKPLEFDLLDDESVAKLPEVKNVIYMAGMKFGTAENISLTWALNTYLPTVIAKRYKNSSIVAFSSGNIYHLTPAILGGATESTPPNPFGDYAQSCLGRERMFEFFSIKNGTKTAIIRLAYAIDLRYGILLDVAQKVYNKTPIDIEMGCVNVIWQADANEQIIRSLKETTSPANIINITGPEIISIRYLAKEFGKIFNIEPLFEGKEAESAILLNTVKSQGLYGYPKTTMNTMIKWIAEWVKSEGKTLNKPTHYETRNGKY
jgi:nucleoside-diphosphate-sugar epimerase